MGELGRDTYTSNDFDINAPDLAGASLWLNQVVYNRQRQQIGYIKDFMLDIHSGEITHAVLLYRESTTTHHTELTVPWAALIFDSSLYAFMFDAMPDIFATKRRWDTSQFAGTSTVAMRLVGSA